MRDIHSEATNHAIQAAINVAATVSTTQMTRQERSIGHSSDRGSMYERERRNEKNKSRRKHCRNLREPYSECSKLDGKCDIEDVIDSSDSSLNTEVLLDTHIDKSFSDFNSKFYSDLEQASSRKRKKREKSQQTGQ